MDICLPSIIYFFLSFIQIIIDCNNKLFNTAIVKFIITIIFVVILNLLCNNGLIILSWLFVLIPFIFMTVIVSLLLYHLNLDKSSGVLIKTQDNVVKKNIFPYIFTEYQ
uniref:Uncharacterized protein n=1 Tax=viral metagenome TaxID=1070528 RepID=A0A6C0H6D2_9ZZZZ